MQRQPKSTKFRKFRKGQISRPLKKSQLLSGKSFRRSHLKYGDFGLAATNFGKLSSQQLEAGRRTLTGNLQRKGKVWIRTFPDLPVTQKPTSARMGKGKGPVEKWVAWIRPGRVIYELAGVKEEQAMEAMKKVGKKLPFESRTLKSIEAKNERKTEK